MELDPNLYGPEHHIIEVQCVHVCVRTYVTMLV